MNTTTCAYLLTQSLQLTNEELLVLLHDFGGQMPNDQQQYNAFVERLRLHLQRQDRVREGRTPLNFAGDNRPGQPQYPGWETEWDDNTDYEDWQLYPSWEEDWYESQTQLAALEQLKNVRAIFADLSRNMDEQRAKRVLDGLSAGDRLVLMIPGCPVKAGTRKDRRRMARAILLGRLALTRGVVPFLVVPEHSALLQSLELQQLLREDPWHRVSLPVCALGVTVQGPGGVFRPIKGAVHVVSPNKFKAPVCTHLGEHQAQDKSMPRPRPEAIAVVKFLMQVKLATQLNRTTEVGFTQGATHECATAILEVCGGTTPLSVEFLSHGFTVGSNIDIVAGDKYDLSKKSGRQLLKATWLKEKPALLCAAPPCTFLAGFSKLNSLHDPERFREGRKQAEVIANAVADLCEKQAYQGKWFLIENPQRSDLWSIPSIDRLLRVSGTRRVVLDQCRYGLVDEKGVAIKKPTVLLTNLPHAETLLASRCQKDHEHQRLEGGPRVRRAQVWPQGLARAMYKVATLAFEDAEMNLTNIRNEQAYPVQFDLCLGCRGHKSSLDPSHTRVEGQCRWPDLGEATQKARAYAPRPTATTRLVTAKRTFKDTPRKGETKVAATSQSDHASGSLTRPGEPDVAQELQIQSEQPEAGTEARTNDSEKARGSRDQRRVVVDATTQASDGADAANPEAYDLTRVAATLQQEGQSVPVIRSIIRRLHHRWWHASSQKMRQIMSSAGLPRSTLDEIGPVVDSCSICRSWKRPHARPQ
eukprot:4494436-Amphidinium_carterae.2